MSSGNTLTVKLLLEADQIRRFYMDWEEPKHYWRKPSRKQIKVETREGAFISLNRFKSRVGFRKLKNLSVELEPVHVYMSVLDWLMPERVASKDKCGLAYPVGGEYVLDLDHYLSYKPHGHRTEPEGFCYGCLSHIKEITESAVDAVSDNYRDIRVVFSGKRGFHVHVLDFDVRDWTHYDEANPLKSHEVARFKYSLELQKKTPFAFDDTHFTLSSDVTRVITYPDSLNGESGLVCVYLGKPRDFSKLSVEDIIKKASRKKHITESLNWTVASAWRNPRYNLLHSP